MAVLSVLCLVLAGMMNQSFKLLSMGQNQAQTLQTLRVVSHIIAQDLQGAVLPADPANVTSFQFIQNPGGITTDENPDAIFWQTATVNDAVNSDIACVGYFVMWDTTNAGNPRGKLCRFYDTSNDAANYVTYASANWITPGLIQAVASGTKAGNYQGLLADNVIGFWVTFEAVDAQGNSITLSKPFNSRADHRLPTDAILSYAFIDPSAAARLTPADVTVIQSHYNDYSASNPPLFINALPKSLQPVVHIYSTRVLFRRSN